MEFRYDKESGAFFVRVRDGQPYEALDLAPGAYLHVDENGYVVGVEFLSFEEFAALTDRERGGLKLPDRIEDPANWGPSELTKA